LSIHFSVKIPLTDSAPGEKQTASTLAFSTEMRAKGLPFTALTGA
jgi:hypothetical protein